LEDEKQRYDLHKNSSGDQLYVTHLRRLKLLLLPKLEKGKLPYELVADGEKPSKLITFNESIHIKKKKPSETIDSFSGRDNNDLDLD
jgi:hypothetical protein